MSVTAYEAIVQACTAGWSRWFVDGLGQWRMYNRHHRAFGSSTDYTLYDVPPSVSAAMFVQTSAFRMSVSTVVNKVTVNHYPRIIGSVPEVLARLYDTSALTIGPLQSAQVTLSYRDPSGTTAQVGAMSVIAMVGGTDYVATYDQSGEGASALGDVSYLASYGATQTGVVFTNNSSTQNVYLRNVQVRGYAIRMRAAGQTQKTNASSISLYGTHELVLSTPLISQYYEAERLAQFVLNQFVSPTQEIFDISVNAWQGDAAAAMVRDIEPLDTLTLDHSRIGYSTDVSVAMVTHSGDSLRGHTVRLSCDPAFRYLGDDGSPVNNRFDIGDPIGSATQLMVW